MLSTIRYEDKHKYVEIKTQTRRVIGAEKNEIRDRKYQDFNTHIGGRKCTEAWKFIKRVRTSGKETVELQMVPTGRRVQYYRELLTESVHLQMVPTDRWVQFYGELLTESVHLQMVPTDRWV